MIVEEILVDVCLHGMIEDCGYMWRTCLSLHFMVNGSFQENRARSMQWSDYCWGWDLRFLPYNKIGGQRLQFKESFAWNKEVRSFHVLPSLPCCVEKAIVLLKQRNKDEVISLPNVEFLPNIGVEKDMSNIHIVERSGTPLYIATSSTEFFIRSRRHRRPILSETGNLIACLFLKHDNRGKAHAMLPSHHEMDRVAKQV